MSFSESSLLNKLQELNGTQQSVQTLSLWLIHHRKHSSTIVSTWLRELTNTSNTERKLTLIYLANDILQNSRKKGYEYMNEFSHALSEAFEDIVKYSDDKTLFTLERILNIWKDRKIYADEKIENLRNALHTSKPKSSSSISTSNGDSLTKMAIKSDSPKLANTARKSISSDSMPNNNKVRKLSSQLSNENTKDINGKIEANAVGENSISNAQVNKLTLRQEIAKELSQNTSNQQIPDILELINMLQDLEKSASCDAIVRGRIADLPQKISDVNAIKSLKDRNDAMDLLNQANEALTLLDNYNSRLQQELTNRKQTALSLAIYIRHQLKELENDKKLLEDWKNRLKQAESVKTELQTHLNNLPDLSTIEEAAELTPLPKDLFS
jgi:regulator of Ty1 transposition protein 103